MVLKSSKRHLLFRKQEALECPSAFEAHSFSVEGVMVSKGLEMYEGFTNRKYFMFPFHKAPLPNSNQRTSNAREIYKNNYVIYLVIETTYSTSIMTYVHDG